MSTPHVMFLCHGNICRSPMAEVVARTIAQRQGVDVRFSSTGTSDEEAGHGIDPRAAEVLRDHGYDPGRHTARQITRELVADVDLVVAAEQHHLVRLARSGITVPRTALMTDYDPESPEGAPLPDPWYGGRAEFEETLAVLERGMPVLVGELAAGTDH